MLKSILVQLIAQYQSDCLALQSLGNSNLVANLANNAELPDGVIDALKDLLNHSTETDNNTKELFEEIRKHLFVNEYHNWMDPPRSTVVTHCGEPEIVNHPHQFPLDKLPHLALRMICDYLSYTTSYEYPPVKVSKIHQYSRRLFHASHGQNAWIHAFLKHVVRGEENAAEALLIKCPDLALQKGPVVDYSKRKVFCTALQYAIWAGDWYMYKMILKYMRSPTAEAAVTEQLHALNTYGLGGTSKVPSTYGARFDFQPFITAYRRYLEESKVRFITSDLEPFWLATCKEQAMLPAHVIQQYCHPNRSFLMDRNPPVFNESTLPRNNTAKLSFFSSDEAQNIFMSIQFGIFSISKGRMGKDFGLMRVDHNHATIWRAGLGFSQLLCESTRTADLNAIIKLCEVIQWNYAETFIDLPEHANKQI